MIEKFEELKREYEELQNKLTLPEVIRDSEKLKEYGRRHGELRAAVEKYDLLLELEDQFSQAESLYQQETGEMRELAEEDMNKLREEIEDVIKELDDYLAPSDSDAAKDIIMELRAGTGGEEAALFCAELFRMYSRFAESMSWKTDIYNSNPTGLGGLKEIIFAVEGKKVYENLKWESGVHRVQRVPKTEAGGRIHTSACSVAVLPQANDVEVEINKDDLRIDTYRSSGKGGQHVNVTDSAVRITHMSTGIVVQCQDERSQMQNKRKAMNILRARLMEKIKRDQAEKEARERRTQVGTGDRSEKIRTYNFPQNRVTDHRVGLSVHSLELILEGDLKDFINEVKKKMKAKQSGES
jgi:peptide chain release factor 1